MLISPDPTTVPAAMGALVGAAGTDGRLDDGQARVLAAVGQVVAGQPVDVGHIEPLAPDEAAAAITDPDARLQLLHAMVALAFVEHPPAPHRDRTLKAYAEAFGLDDGALRVVHDLVEGHARRMFLDTFRNTPMFEWEKAFAHDEGVPTVVRSMVATFGHAEAPELAARFEALEGCPAGSLGRKVWEMYADNHWPFPGQRHGVPEGTTVHDWVHVLAGYAPTAIGEIQVTAFIAANSPDPAMFSLLVLSLGLYEAGAFKVPLLPQAPAGGALEQPGGPEALADALRRGRDTPVDLLLGIDHWALADEPVAELRTRFAIPPKDELHPTTDPGA